MKAMRECEALMVKSGTPCARPAQSMSRFCGLHSKVEQARRSEHATAQWEANRQRNRNEVATEQIVNHKYAWCRARIFHALAGANEQGVLADVLEELFEGTDLEDRRSEIAVIANNVLRRWQSGHEPRDGRR